MAPKNPLKKVFEAYKTGEMLPPTDTTRLSPLGQNNLQAGILGSLAIGAIVAYILDGSHPSSALDAIGMAACSGGVLGVVMNRTLAGWNSAMEHLKPNT